ncbi:MAG: ABC transporter permease [Salinarimonas sp.]|nr:ABC transporter permease [Salinarimonas sp.]
MLDFIVQRLVQAVFVMLTVAMISFSLFQFVGDPVNNMLGPEATAEQRLAARETLGLNDPIPVQFTKWVGNAVQGEFGQSYRMGRPVSDLIAQRLPATLELVAVSALIAVFVGVPMGVYTGLKRNSFLSKIFLTVSLIGISLPTFLIGILLILLFGVTLGWLPTFGRGGLTNIGNWETSLLTARGWSHLILPAITLALFQLTLIMRLVRAEMLEVLRTDYIKFAKARGLRQRSINFGHALKNTLVPVITIMGLQIGALLAFSIITETVFQWPGMGLLIIQAINFGDIPIMSSYLVLVALFFVIINLVVDLLYYVVDPRLRIERTAGAH